MRIKETGIASTVHALLREEGFELLGNLAGLSTFQRASMNTKEPEPNAAPSRTSMRYYRQGKTDLCILVDVITPDNVQVFCEVPAIASKQGFERFLNRLRAVQTGGTAGEGDTTGSPSETFNASHYGKVVAARRQKETGRAGKK